MKVLRPVLAVGAVALLAGPARAQERYATVDVRAGYTLPLSDAKTMFKGQSSFGAGAAIALANKIHLGLSFDYAHHSVKQSDAFCTAAGKPAGCVVGGPDDEEYNIAHLFLKVSFDAVDMNHWTVSFNAGPGLMFFSPNDVLKAKGLEGDRHFAVNAGATITWWFADRIGILLSPQADLAFSRSSGHVFIDKKALLLPLTGGFRFKI